MKLYYKDNGYARVVTDDGRDISLLNFCKEQTPDGVKLSTYYGRIKENLKRGLDLIGAIKAADNPVKYPDLQGLSSKDYQREYYHKTKGTKSSYYSQNKEARKAYAEKYFSDMEKVSNRNAKVAKSRAKKASAYPASWIGELEELMFTEIYRHSIDMAEAFGGNWEVDHILPINGTLACGLHVPSNLQVLTKEANMAKGNRLQDV